MDRRKKLMATPSCRGVSGVDRFSDLPEEVPHHILSFLTITDVTRFGCVSKRCRQLHPSAPSLKFEGFSEANLSSGDKLLRLINALDSISADKLVRLVIDWGFHRCKKVLNITAPKLKYLRLEGNSLMHQNLGEWRCLEKTNLCLRPEGDDINILPEIISSIQSVKVLILGHDTLKALFQKGSRPAALDNVRHLCMHVGYMLDDVTPAMLSILKGIPNLSTLYIKSYPLFFHDASESSGIYWKLLNLAALDQLEEVSIELPNGSNGIDLASYMLEHTKSLKKMVIVHSPQQFGVARELRQLLIAYGKSNLRVVLVEDQKRATLEEISRRVSTPRIRT
ncbi:PREDICTED: putative F-box/FBD/LRR-repeat protein At5g44950-like [Fragaria vesca subsp. vesca]